MIYLITLEIRGLRLCHPRVIKTLYEELTRGNPTSQSKQYMGTLTMEQSESVDKQMRSGEPATLTRHW